MNCRECDEEVKVWGCVLLCDKCLCARLWRELEEDDYVLVRRKRGGGEIWLSSQKDGNKRGTNLTALKLGVVHEAAERLAEIF